MGDYTGAVQASGVAELSHSPPPNICFTVHGNVPLMPIILSLSSTLSEVSVHSE